MRLISATMTNAARTVAAPDSSAIRLGRRNRLGGDDKTGKQRGAAADPGQDVTPVAADLQRRTRRRQAGGGGNIPAGGQPCRFAGRVDAADLQCGRHDAGGT